MSNEYDHSENSDSINENYHYYKHEERPAAGSAGKVRRERTSGGTFGRKLRTTIVLAVIFGLVSGVTFQMVNRVGERYFPSESSDGLTKEMPVFESEEAAFMDAGIPEESSAYSVADVAAIGLPSIVAITSVSIQEIPDFFGAFWGFGGTQRYPSTGSGSGIIIGENENELLIATNSHVVSGADTITVCFIGGDVQSAQQETTSYANGNSEEVLENSVSGKLKGEDTANDLAVIAVKLADIPEDTRSQLSIATLGDSDAMAVGEQVVAIGNALGFGQSVTSGYVSAFNRSITTEEGAADISLIQTDAAINPGNSGGALLNMRGEVIGINSAKYADNAVEGMGYAILMTAAQPILEDLMSRKTREPVEDETKAAYLGISLLDLTNEMILMYDLPRGAYVKSVTPGGPAETGGIRKGDIITGLDGQTITGRDDVSRMLSYYEAGEEISAEIYRFDGGEYVRQEICLLLGRKEETESYGGAQMERGMQSKGSDISSIEDFFHYFG